MALREDLQADADFQHSLKLNPNDSDTHNNYGWFLCQRGKELDSVTHFLAAVKNPLYSTPEKAYLNAGLCSKKGGNTKAADEYLRKALAFRSDIPEALLGLSEMNYTNGNYEGARSYFQRFMLRHAPSATAANLWMAVHIERKLNDKVAENNYAMQMRKRFPDARETQLLQSGK